MKDSFILNWVVRRSYNFSTVMIPKRLCVCVCVHMRVCVCYLRANRNMFINQLQKRIKEYLLSNYIMPPLHSHYERTVAATRVKLRHRYCISEDVFNRAE